MAGGDDASCSVHDLVQEAVLTSDPMRHFTWRRDQRHRPGLQFLTSTGRHHGAESLEESRVLLALDFAGDVVDVVSQSTLVLALTSQITRLKKQHREEVQALRDALEQAHGENLDLRRELARRGGPTPPPQ